MLKGKKWVKCKMAVESEFGEFNRQTDLISTGTVYSGTQRSKCIRPYGMKQWAGKEFENGELLSKDMDGFQPIGSATILDAIYDRGREGHVILYEFFVKKYDRRGGVKRDVLGHVLTDADNKLIAYTAYVPASHNVKKRRSALFEAMNYVVDGWCEMSDMERLSWKPDTSRRMAVGE